MSRTILLFVLDPKVLSPMLCYALGASFLASGVHTGLHALVGLSRQLFLFRGKFSRSFCVHGPAALRTLLCQHYAGADFHFTRA